MAPELAHWFHIRHWELDDLTEDESVALLKKLETLPPIGGVVVVNV